MNPIPLDAKAAARALAALLARIAELRAATGNGTAVYGPPAWLAQPARPTAAWQASRYGSGRQRTALLYQFDLAAPFAVGHAAVAGYVLLVEDGGGRVDPVWRGREPAQVAEAMVVAELMGHGTD